MGKKHNLATVGGIQQASDEAVQECLAQRLPHPNATVDAGADWETPTSTNTSGVVQVDKAAARDAKAITRKGA